MVKKQGRSQALQFHLMLEKVKPTTVSPIHLVKHAPSLNTYAFGHLEVIRCLTEQSWSDVEDPGRAE
jgi:hypothetical protein